MLNKILLISRREGIFVVFIRAWSKFCRELTSSLEEVSARYKSSYRLNSCFDKFDLNPRLGKAVLVGITIEKCIPQQVFQHYLAHRFDLLGSGWVQIRHGMHCRGMVGYNYETTESVAVDGHGCWLQGRLNVSNLSVAQSIWKLVDHHYCPIDWQLDFKSGYRWTEATWASRLQYGHLLGVDVKIPWELSRMQHLPQMVLRVAAGGIEAVEAHKVVREIRNQLLDFISTNPPGFGVNWMCPMDIAIRGANWCLTLDILRSAGFSLEKHDLNIIIHSLYDHGSYILRHLEWSKDRANHYLADICGLIFIATYLPVTQETDCWLAFCIGQLQVETLRQFLPDGGNFEGSTAYHRLSLEMVLYATALVLGLPEERLARLSSIDVSALSYLPKSAGVPHHFSLYKNCKTIQSTIRFTPFTNDFVERLRSAVDFFAAVLRPDGFFPQIGDNDSGRFFKINPLYNVMPVRIAKQRYLNLEGYVHLPATQPYFFEEHCYGKNLLFVASELGIFHDTSLTRVDGEIDRFLINGLTGGSQFISDQLHKSSIPFGDSNEILELAKSVSVHPAALTKTFTRTSTQSIDSAPVTYRNFPDFGLHVWQSSDLFITVRSLETINIYPMSHFHDDQLGVDVCLNGIFLLASRDYVYTPFPELRNNYRGRKAHFPTSVQKLPP